MNNDAKHKNYLPLLNVIRNNTGRISYNKTPFHFTVISTLKKRKGAPLESHCFSFIWFSVSSFLYTFKNFVSGHFFSDLIYNYILVMCNPGAAFIYHTLHNYYLHNKHTQSQFWLHSFDTLNVSSTGFACTMFFFCKIIIYIVCCLRLAWFVLISLKSAYLADDSLIDT